MNLLETMILGVVEGVTEFLPVSSTGHLILVSHFLKIVQSDFLKSFEIAIQMGAILSVLVLYWHQLTLNFMIFKRMIISFIPTGIIGLCLYKTVKHYFLGDSRLVLWSLFLGGIFLVVFELFYHEKKDVAAGIEDISYGQALMIGIFQSVAIIPGVSRSAATIIGGLSLGLSRKQIVEFSFLAALPVMFAASALDMVKMAGQFSGEEFGLLSVGFTVSFFVAMVAIRFLIGFVKKNNFIIFGVYRILAAITGWIILFSN
jgi:undecaprenyl-diphosphatase